MMSLAEQLKNASSLKTLVARTDTYRLVLQATLRPVAGLDRFQPAGFPEVGHVIYKAPRKDGEKPSIKDVCIVDSAPGMANHLEAVCLDAPGADLVADLEGLPHVRCVTGEKADQLVATTFTEGHRLASDLFLEGIPVAEAAATSAETTGEATPTAKAPKAAPDPKETTLEATLLSEMGLRDLGKKTHPLPEQWWKVFSVVIKYDPNSLVHGVLFQRWGIKISRLLTAVHEAIGAARVPSSGVKFDKLGLTGSGQPIFAKDEETAEEIRSTFVIDLALLRSFGRTEKSKNGEGGTKGLTGEQKALLLALCLWKVGALLRHPFRYRTACDLECTKLRGSLDGKEEDGTVTDGEELKPADLTRSLTEEIRAACSASRPATRVYRPEADIYKKAEESAAKAAKQDEDEVDQGDDEEAGDEAGDDDEEA